MTLPVRDALARAAGVLHAAGIESARLDARVLLAFALGVSPEFLVTVDEVSAGRIGEFDRLLARRANREPLAYITGTREFWSLSFTVGPGVLIPRPETETLIETALKEFPETAMPLRVLDIGTGSGCLLVALLAERAPAIGTGVDRSDAALGYARRNVSAHGLDRRVHLVRSSWCPPGDGVFDMILSNPPYLSEAEFESAPPEIRNHEPRTSLVAGPDGLAAMRALGPVLGALLAPSGLAFFEIGTGQRDAATQILQSCGLEVRRAVPDLSGVPRCLVIGRPG
ncbi:MAG: peptide chain release factor N(5)-glutamine methyltransferase [Rhizomicrobium sp.]